MEFQFTVEAAGLERKLTLVADAAKKLDPALRTFDRYLRARVRSRFEQEGPGWAPLATSTLAHRRQAAMAALERKLGRDVRRAGKSYARRFGALDQLGLGGLDRQRARSMLAVQRRVTTLAEFRRIMAGGSASASLFEGRTAEKQRQSLAGRIGRAEAHANEKVLGRIAGSIRSTIKNGTLTVESRIPWAGVHNEGGRAGKANIPARPFLYLDGEDLDVLTEILANHLLLHLEG
ncbi:MAG TPA: phage virion morphogenesis protein [Polyangiaceae bacterium]|nr:phage virion morphogenesis protein [Polyangiaceae bacterium]